MFDPKKVSFVIKGNKDKNITFVEQKFMKFIAFGTRDIKPVQKQKKIDFCLLGGKKQQNK